MTKLKSHILDSSDDEQESKENDYRSGSNKYKNELSKIKSSNLSNENKYSCLLNEISSRLLFSTEVTQKYKEIKDPLAIAKLRIEKIKQVLTNAKDGVSIGINKFNEYDKETAEYTLMIQKNEEYTSQISVLQDEIQCIDNLQNKRNKINEDLKGLFSFVPRKPSYTFVQKCLSNNASASANVSFLGSDELEIAQKLAEYRYQLVTYKLKQSSSEFVELCKFFNLSADNNQHAQLRNQIEKIIGRYPEDNEINEGARLRNYNGTDFAGAAKTLIDNNLGKLYKNLEEITQKIYIDNTTKYKYRSILNNQKEIIDNLNQDSNNESKLDFLVQVRANRKFDRNVYKDALIKDNLSGSDNQKFSLPPGSNTTVTLYKTGSAAHFLGELGSYQEIVTTQEATLEKYKDIITNNQEHIERTEDFRNLCQIEAIRNPSALLTNAMFFDLVEKDIFQIKELPNKMPMAMRDAVTGAIALEEMFKDNLTSRLLYDYRYLKSPEANNNAQILAARNNNILHQWLINVHLQKAGISIANIIEVIKGSESTTVGEAKKKIEKVTNETEIGFFNNGDKATDNTSLNIVNKITLKKNNYCIELELRKIIDCVNGMVKSDNIFYIEIKGKSNREALKKIEEVKDKNVFIFSSSAIKKYPIKDIKEAATVVIKIFNPAVIKTLIEPTHVKIIDKIVNLKNGSNADTEILPDEDMKDNKKTVKNFRNDEIKDIVNETNSHNKKRKTGAVDEFNTKVQAHADEEAGDEYLAYLQGNENIGITITSFPLSVFNELFTEWYGIKLPYLENNKIEIGNLKLKAAAEPKDDDEDSDQYQDKISSTDIAEDNQNGLNPSKSNINSAAQELSVTDYNSRLCRPQNIGDCPVYTAQDALKDIRIKGEYPSIQDYKTRENIAEYWLIRGYQEYNLGIKEGYSMAHAYYNLVIKNCPGYQWIAHHNNGFALYNLKQYAQAVSAFGKHNIEKIGRTDNYFKKEDGNGFPFYKELWGKEDEIITLINEEEIHYQELTLKSNTYSTIQKLQYNYPLSNNNICRTPLPFPQQSNSPELANFQGNGLSTSIIETITPNYDYDIYQPDLLGANT